jgi:GT2 family glycosyltransferase
MHLDDAYVAAAGPLVLAADGSTIRCGGLWIHDEVGPVAVLPTPLDDAGRAGWHLVPRAVTAVHGTGLAVRAERWRALGGFAAGLPGSIHDVDLCRRAQVGGDRVVLEPRSRLVHHGITSQLWGWNEELAELLAARCLGSPDPVSSHAHPAADWRRPGRPIYLV